MSVEQLDVVDFLGEDPKTGKVVLGISDHLPWDHGEHRRLLEAKIEAYLTFTESPDLAERYPDLPERGVTIEVILKHPPTAQAKEFLENERALLEGSGIGFSYLMLPEKYAREHTA